MPRYVAFLRAINVGGHVVKMERLRQLFTKLGFAGVETFIASGNIIFQSAARDAARLEGKIETALESELGYAVKTFLRTDAEVAEIAAHEAFEGARELAKGTLFIGLLKIAPLAADRERLLGACTATDEFHVDGRELYWFCRGKSNESAFPGAKLEKTLGMATTLRNSNTLRRLAAKYPPRAA